MATPLGAAVETAGPPPPPPPVVSATGGGAPLEANPAAMPLSAGRYLLHTVVVAAAAVPVLGQVRSTTTATALVDLRHEGDALLGTQHVCFVEVGERDSLVRTTFPAALIAALPPRQFKVAFEPGVGERRVRIDLGVEHLGYRPGAGGDETEDGLPSHADDARVIDLDQDGKPGATVMLELGRLGQHPLAVVSRGHTVLEGRIRSRGRVEGRATLQAFAQRVLDGLPVHGRVDRVESVPDASAFWLHALPPDANCAQARASAQALSALAR